jgi:Rare lipoprotein B
MNTQTGSFVMLRSMTMLCLLSVSLMACGFKLRGAVDLPEDFKKFILQALNTVI